jgi:hypothetical protein
LTLYESSLFGVLAGVGTRKESVIRFIPPAKKIESTLTDPAVKIV